MKTEIEKLITLSNIDTQIDALLQEKQDLPQEIISIKNKLKNLLLQAHQKEQEISRLNNAKRQKELEITEHKEATQKSEEKLKDIKNNKEYHAALREISQSKKTISQLEDEVLSLMTQTEEIAKGLNESETKVSEEKAALEVEIAEKQKHIDGIDSQIDQKKSERQQFEKDIKEEFLKKYKIIKTRITPALARTENGYCMECYTRIPPQVYIELQKFHNLIICPRCNRILYVQETTPNGF